MAAKKLKARAAAAAADRQPAEQRPSSHKATARQTAGSNDASNGTWSSTFSRMANWTAHFAGKPQAFLIALIFVVIWALTGPLFGYSDTWQLVINTATTVVTFLMVFLIQHSQNRDTLALQLKLAELIIVIRGAKNSLATIEDMEEDDLEQLHEEYRRRAEEALAHLNSRRGNTPARAG